MGPFWVLSLIKIPLVSPSLDQKELNRFTPPPTQLCPISPMLLYYFPFPIQKLPFAPLGLTDEERPPRLPRLLRDDDPDDRHVH